MPRPLPVGLAGRIHRLDRLVLAYHPPQFLPRARVGLLNRGHPWPLFGGEAVACRDDGVASFDLIRHWHHADGAFLYAFDLIELNGDDLRRDPLIVRKATLASVLARAAPGLRLNEHIEHDGPIVFAHACRMGLEGIVSKRKASPYRSGRTADWIKSKNPDAPAVKREAEQEWDRWPSKKARPSSRC